MRTLKEDFQRMGLSSELAEDSVVALTGDESGGELGEDQEGDDVLDIVESYKGGIKKRAGVPAISTQKVGSKYGYDAIHDNAVDAVSPGTSKGRDYRLGEEDEDDDDEMSEDVLDILEGYRFEKKKRLTSTEKTKSKQYRRSAAGKKAARKSAMAARKPQAKLQRKKRVKKMAKLGGPKKGYRRVQSWANYDGEGEEMKESILENLSVLAEAIDKDPTDRFNEFVEAFNHIADIGEILTIRYHEMGEEDLAEESIELAMKAEAMLEEMENLDGALSLDEDAALDAALAEALEETAEYMSDFENLREEYEDDEDEDEEEFDEDEDVSDILKAARSIAEAAKVAKGKGRLKGAAKKGKKGRKKGIGKGKKMKKQTSTGKLTKFEKKLTKGRSDIRNPAALAGNLRWWGSYNKKTGKFEKNV